MRAVVYDGPKAVSVQDVPDAAVEEPTDVVVEVQHAGVCGSDLHIYHGEVPGVMEGMTLGHEFVGKVVEAGDAVRRVREGDTVVASFQAPCGTCPACRRGAYNGCQELYVFGYGMGFGSIGGAQAERVRVPRADLCLRPVPAGVSPEEALFAGDILSTAYTGVRPHLSPGDTVAVVGAGPLGLLCMDVARALGAGHVYAVDLDPSRISWARERGHTALDPREADPVSTVMDETSGFGCDLVIEAVGGRGAALETAFSLVGAGGHVTALGVPTEFEFTYPWLEGFNKGFSFQPTLANVPRWIDEVLSLQAAGRLEASWLISHRMGLDEAPQAYDLFDRHEALKVVLEP